MIRIGLDLGGTKTEIAALDRDGTELLRRRVPTPADRYEDAVRSLAALVTRAEGELGREARVGLGHPGAIDPATGLLTGTYKVGGLVGLDQRDHEWGLCEYGDPEPTSFVEMVRRNIASSGVHVTHDGDVLRSPRLRDFIVPYFSYSDERRVVGVAGERPWGGVAMFRDFKASGRLATPEDAALRIADRIVLGNVKHGAAYSWPDLDRPLPDQGL